MNNKKTNTAIALTAIGALAWFSFAIYLYCSGNDNFFANHSSLYFRIGSKAIDISAISAGLSAIFSTFYLIKQGKNKHNFINIAISYPIAAFFILMYLIAKITGGA